MIKEVTQYRVDIVRYGVDTKEIWEQIYKLQSMFPEYEIGLSCFQSGRHYHSKEIFFHVKYEFDETEEVLQSVLKEVKWEFDFYSKDDYVITEIINLSR